MLLRLMLADLKMIVRNKQALFWAIAFPILFATIFGLFNFDDIGTADIAVFGDPPRAAAPIEAAIGDVEALQLEDYDTIAEAREALADDELTFVMLVRDGEPVRLEFNEADADQSTIFLPVVQKVIDELNIELSGIARIYDLAIVGVAGIDVQYYDFVLPGLVGMAVMTYGIIGLGGTVATYRKQQILKRIRATPLRPSTFVAGLIGAHLVLAVVQSAIVLAWGVFVFGGSVRGNVASIMVLVLLGNLTFMNLGFVVAARAESAEAASGMGNAIAMPMMFFSGVFFPTAGLPWILPQVTNALPLKPMIDAIRDISITGASLTEHLGDIAQLGAWAVITFVIATRFFRFERA